MLSCSSRADLSEQLPPILRLWLLQLLVPVIGIRKLVGARHFFPATTWQLCPAAAQVAYLHSAEAVEYEKIYRNLSPNQKRPRQMIQNVSAFCQN